MPIPVKPPPLEPGSVLRIITPASPVEERALRKGCEELERLGYVPRWDPRVLARQGYFAGSVEERLAKFHLAFEEHSSSAVFCARGGYGSSYLLDRIETRRMNAPKALVGFSDVTALQLYLWRKKRWVSFYGPMVASGFNAGAGAPAGYEPDSFLSALTQTNHGWSLELQGETLFAGQAEGIVLGGCLTLIEAMLGTPWEIETRGTILLLEDRAMKPYQVDRALIHLFQASKLKGVRGLILGEFPECEPPSGSATVREVFERLVEPLKIPVVWGVPIGHALRPMLTLPLGIRAELSAHGAGRLEILEPACSAEQGGKLRTRKSPRNS